MPNVHFSPMTDTTKREHKEMGIKWAIRILCVCIVHSRHTGFILFISALDSSYSDFYGFSINMSSKRSKIQQNIRYFIFMAIDFFFLYWNSYYLIRWIYVKVFVDLRRYCVCLYGNGAIYFQLSNHEIKFLNHQVFMV